MSKYLPEGYTQEKIDEILDFQRINKIYLCRLCKEWVKDLPTEHNCKGK